MGGILSFSVRGGVRGVIAAVFAVMASLIVVPTASADAYSCVESVPGPGTWNKSCMEVYGYSVRVDKVEARLTSTTAPYFPADVCNVRVDVWGTKAGSGVPWSQSGTNTGCGRGSLGMIFYPGEHFQNGSYFCSRTWWSGQAGAANCIVIRA